MDDSSGNGNSDDFGNLELVVEHDLARSRRAMQFDQTFGLTEEVHVPFRGKVKRRHPTNHSWRRGENEARKILDGRKRTSSATRDPTSYRLSNLIAEYDNGGYTVDFDDNSSGILESGGAQALSDPLYQELVAQRIASAYETLRATGFLNLVGRNSPTVREPNIDDLLSLPRKLATSPRAIARMIDNGIFVIDDSNRAVYFITAPVIVELEGEGLKPAQFLQYSASTDYIIKNPKKGLLVVSLPKNETPIRPLDDNTANGNYRNDPYEGATPNFWARHQTPLRERLKH